MKKLLASFIMLFAFILGAFSATVNITYRYMHNGNVWFTETKTATVGESYPEAVVQPDGVKYLTMPTGTVSTAETVDIECVYTNDMFTTYISDTYATAKWVNIAINATGAHLQYVNGQDYVPFNTSQTALPSASDYTYQWAFIGNPISGYKIVNRSAGSGKILSSVAPTGDGGNALATLQDEATLNTTTNNTFWSLTKATGKHLYYIARQGETFYMNSRANKLSFWNYTGTGSQFIITPIDLTLTTSLDTSKDYMLVDRRTGKAISESTLWNLNTSSTEHNCAVAFTPDPMNLNSIWTLENSGSGYKLKNKSSSNYLNTVTPSCYETMTNYAYESQKPYIAFSGGEGPGWYQPLKTDGEGVFYFFPTGDGYYTIATASDASTPLVGVYCDGFMTQRGAALFSTNTQWELREVTPTNHATSITSGSYYRLVNRKYIDRSLTVNNGKLYADETDEDSYGQIWKLTKNGSSYSIQNAVTGQYIQTASTDVQCTTGTSAKYFTTSSSTVNGYTVFTFNNGTGIHANSSYKVVGYSTSEDASKWILIPVTVNSTDLSNAQTIMNGNGTNYTTNLTTFFSDYACTTLKSTYQNYSDAQLRSAMSSLPSDLQEMAVRVKNNTWNSDATHNRYEKDFRIHSYDIYSNCDSWSSITNTGAFAHLNNPTGIQAKTGDVIYIFVDSNVQDSDASLQAELVVGTDRTGTTKTLSRGYNAICATGECEVFISYLLNNTSKSCNNYPNIKIHIEGGTCNGFFDMHRGHNNNDWAWLKENMFQNKFLHVKGNSTLLNVLLDGVKAEKNAVGVMNIWDFIFDTEESFSGVDSYKSSGRYKMMINNFHNIDETDAYRGYPYWGAGHGTSHPDLTTSGCFNYNALANSSLWEIAHEIGHAHQAPIKSVGTDETSNNVMSQVIQFLAKDNIGTNMFQSAKATRGDGVKAMTECFNDGWGYIDYMRRRIIERNISVNDNISNRWLFQLWMYFDYMKNYNPTTNQGFDFIGALYNRLRSSALGTGTTVAPNQDYLKMAQYCAEITQTDLSEFFEAWGFWKTAPKYGGLTVHNESESTSSTDSGTTYYAGGYSVRGFNMSNAASQVSSVRSTMQAYTKKAKNIMFLEDRGVNCELDQTMDGLSPQALGDGGYYGDYSKTITGSYKYAVDTDNNTISMSGGKNAVGFKIYDGNGNLVAISNMNFFTVPAAVAAGLANGTYTLVAAQGDGTDVSTTEGVANTIQSFKLNCARGYIYGNGTKIMGTTTASQASELVLVPYNGETYLYDATNKAFACHTTDAMAGTTGNVLLESNSDFSKIVKGLKWGNTNISNYPLYLEDSWTNWLNMDGARSVYMNTWKNFESGNGGNTYTMTVVDTDFDITEAVAMLEAYFNPSATVTYVISDANGVVYTSEAMAATIGQTITALPADLQRAFCSYSSINKTIVNGSNTVNVTVTYSMPFDISTSYSSAKWYNMHIRSGKYVFKGDSEPYYPATATEEQKSTDAYKWAFMGNPYAFQILNKASGADYTLTKDGSNVVMRSGTYAWTLCQNSDGFVLKETGSTNNYVNQNGGATGPLQFWNSTSGATDDGSTFRVEEVMDNFYDRVAAEILPYIFADPTDIINSDPEATIGQIFGISATGAASIVSTYQTQLANQQFSLEEYVAAKALLEANIVYPEDGKIYLVRNTFNNKYLRVAEYGTRGQVFADLTAEEAAQDASAHIEIKVVEDKPYMLSQGNYFNWVYGTLSGYEAWTSSGLDKYAHFVAVSPGVGAFSIAYGNGEGSYASSLGIGFYALKEGTTTVAGSPTDHTNQYAHWIFEEVIELEGDLDGDNDVDTVDLDILIDIIFGKKNPADYNNADLNNDSKYSVADVTKLVNILNEN